MTFARLATTALILLKHDSWRIREKRLVIGAIDVGRMLVIAHFRVAPETDIELGEQPERDQTVAAPFGAGRRCPPL